MSRVVRLSVTNRPASGTQTRRVWMLRFCHLLVLMFECETFCARILRLPVMSLFAMTSLDFARPSGPSRWGGRKLMGARPFVKLLRPERERIDHRDHAPIVLGESEGIERPYDAGHHAR